MAKTELSEEHLSRREILAALCSRERMLLTELKNTRREVYALIAVVARPTIINNKKNKGTLLSLDDNARIGKRRRDCPGRGRAPPVLRSKTSNVS